MKHITESIAVMPWNDVKASSYGVDAARTIYVVGAGVSGNAPTKLPLGNTLGDYYLDTVLSKAKGKMLRDIWKEAMQLVDDYPGAEWFGMRLEFIIGAINKLDIEFQNDLFKKAENNEKFKRYPLIRGFSQFAKLPFNINHRSLSCLAHAGGVILTANYDVCIERVTQSAPLEHSEKRCGIDAVQIMDNHCIYHFHGLASVGQAEYDLGATVDSVKKSFPVDFVNQFKNWLQQGFNIVFVGYSGSDYFDMTPFFEELPEGEYSGTAIFFSYGNKAPDISQKIKTLLRPFSKTAVLYGDTSEYLETIAEAAACDAWRNAVVSQEMEVVIPWEKEFQSIMERYSEDALEAFQFINALRLTGQTGIHIKRLYPDWDKRVNALIKTWDEDGPETLQNLMQKPNDLTQSILGDLLLLNARTTPKGRNTWYERLQSIRGLRETPKESLVGAGVNDIGIMVDEVCKIVGQEIRSEQAQDFESMIIQSINTKCFKNIRKRWSIQKSKREEATANLRELSCYLDKLVAMPYSKFLYVSYFTSLCKKKSLVDYILYDLKSPELEYKMLEISLEISAINEVIRVYRNMGTRRLYEALVSLDYHALVAAFNYFRKAESVRAKAAIMI